MHVDTCKVAGGIDWREKGKGRRQEAVDGILYPPVPRLSTSRGITRVGASLCAADLREHAYLGPHLWQEMGPSFCQRANAGRTCPAAGDGCRGMLCS